MTHHVSNITDSIAPIIDKVYIYIYKYRYQAIEQKEQSNLVLEQTENIQLKHSPGGWGYGKTT